MDKESMAFLIDFNLEVLYGCKWNCSGCDVAKYDQRGFAGEDFDKLMLLFKDLQVNHHILSNLGIGPTDFMTAENSEEVFLQLAPMMDMFCAITLQCTFLEKRDVIEKWAKFLRPILAGRTIKFATPLDPRNYSNRKFFATILENRDYFVSLMPEVNYTKTYLLGNLLEYREYNSNPYNNGKITFEEYSEEFHESSKGNHLDLVISAGRLPLTDINNREKLKAIVKYQNTLYNDAIHRDMSKSAVNFTYGKRHEGFDKDYVYRNGSIYAPVFVGEPLLMFEDGYNIPNTQDWTTKTLVDFETATLVESLLYLDQTDSCATCEFAAACAGRGVIKLMKTLKIKECFAPKQAFIETRQS